MRIQVASTEAGVGVKGGVPERLLSSSLATLYEFNTMIVCPNTAAEDILPVICMKDPREFQSDKAHRIFFPILSTLPTHVPWAYQADYR